MRSADNTVLSASVTLALTGSMATTLLGYHREVRCDKCGYPFLVNASKEHDPQEPHPQRVINCTCPNCEFTNRITGPMPGGGR